jgi:hypothetical protein
MFLRPERIPSSTTRVAAAPSKTLFSNYYLVLAPEIAQHQIAEPSYSVS